MQLNFERVRAAISTLADVGVVIGFVMVAIQLHQNSIALAANANALMTAAFLESETTMIGDNGSEAFAVSVANPAELTDTQIVQLWGYYAASIQPVHVAYQAYREGAIERDVYLARVQTYAEDYLTTDFARTWWQHQKDFGPGEIAIDIDAALERSPSPRRVTERFNAIRADVRALQAQ